MDTPRRRLHVDVAEKLLDRAEIVTPSGERVAYRWQQRVMSDGRRHAERGSAAEGGADENWWKADRRSAPIVCQGSGERIFFLDCAPSAVYVHLKFLLGTRVRGVSWVSGLIAAKEVVRGIGEKCILLFPGKSKLDQGGNPNSCLLSSTCPDRPVLENEGVSRKDVYFRLLSHTFYVRRGAVFLGINGLTATG